MAILLWVHHVNSWVCLLLGLPLNCLILWLIFRRTSRDLKMYSRILMQSSILDIILSLLAEFVQPVFLVKDGVAQDLMVSQFSWLPNPANHLLFMCWFMAFYLSMVGLGVQFVYRYLVLCRDIQINILGYFGLLSVAFLLQMPMIALLSISTYPSSQSELVNADDVLELLGKGPAENGTWRLALQADTQKPIVLCWLASYLLYNSALYAIIIFCALKIRRTLARRMAQFKLPKSSADLNGQITRTLLVQAFLPFLPLLLTTIAVSSILLFPDVGTSAIMVLQMLVTMPLSWLPVTNPLVTLLVVKQYRRWLFDVGWHCLGKGNSNSSISKRTLIVQRRVLPTGIERRILPK